MNIVDVQDLKLTLNFKVISRSRVPSEYTIKMG